MKVKELREKSVAELQAYLKECRENLVKLRFSRTLGELKGSDKIVKTKVTIARILTIITEKTKAVVQE